MHHILVRCLIQLYGLGLLDMPTTILYQFSIDSVQPMQDYTPFIVDDSSDASSFIGEHLWNQFHDGLVAKGGSFLPMAGYERFPQREMIGEYLHSCMKDTFNIDRRVHSTRTHA